MPEQVLLDTNVMLRVLLADEPSTSPDCRRLFEEAEALGLDLYISHLALAEMVAVLTGAPYRRPRAQVARQLRLLLDEPAVRVDVRDMLREAIDLYAETGVDFIDAYHAADARRRRIELVCSYNEAFEGLPIARAEPSVVLLA